MFKNLIFVSLGGALGSVLRYSLGLWFSRFFQSAFPWATFIINILGCLLFGVLFSTFAKMGEDMGAWKLLLLTGFCGGFTTFSAFGHESVQLLNAGNYTCFLAYVFGSLMFGFLLFYLGYICVK